MKHKVLSIRQPWAWLIAHGHKDIENRNWNTLYRGPLLIHASLQMTADDYRPAQRLAARLGITIPPRSALELGGIVGIAKLRGCYHVNDSHHVDGFGPWFFGPYGFKLVDARPLPFFSCRGKLNIFEIDIPEEVIHGTP